MDGAAFTTVYCRSGLCWWRPLAGTSATLRTFWIQSSCTWHGGYRIHDELVESPPALGHFARGSREAPVDRPGLRGLLEPGELCSAGADHREVGGVSPQRLPGGAAQHHQQPRAGLLPVPPLINPDSPGYNHEQIGNGTNILTRTSGGSPQSLRRSAPERARGTYQGPFVVRYSGGQLARTGSADRSFGSVRSRTGARSHHERQRMAEDIGGDTFWIDADSPPIRFKKEIPYNRFVWMCDHNYLPQPSTFWRRGIYEEAGGRQRPACRDEAGSKRLLVIHPARTGRLESFIRE
jgi:hypothetical protein